MLHTSILGAEKALGIDRLDKLKKQANTINKTPWSFKEIQSELKDKIGEING